MLKTPSGEQLCLSRLQASRRPRAIVQFVRIPYGQANFDWHSARILAEQDFLVYVENPFSHKGGAKPNAAWSGNHALPARLLLEQALTIHDFIARQHQASSILLFGHSISGMLLLALLSRFPLAIAGAYVCNSLVVSRLLGRIAETLLLWERFRLGSDVPSRLIPRLLFPSMLDTGNALGARRPPEDGDFADGPSCLTKLTIGQWRSALELNRLITARAAFATLRRDLPIRFMELRTNDKRFDGPAPSDLETHLRRKGFLRIETKTYREDSNRSRKNLNRNIILSDFALWASRKTGLGPF